MKSISRNKAGVSVMNNGSEKFGHRLPTGFYHLKHMQYSF